MTVTTNKKNKLVGRLINGERQAQSLFFDQYASWAYAICIRYLPASGTAEEAVQDGFLKIFKSIKIYDSTRANLKTWMSRIFINVCLDRLRIKSTIFHDNMVGLEEIGEIEDFYDDCSDSELFSLIKKMPEGYRVIFNLYAIEGYDHNEIGESLKISSSTSRSQYYRAKQWLRKNFQINNSSDNEQSKFKAKI